jgi:hypothetical protein
VISLTKSKIVFKPLPEDDPKQRQPDIALAARELWRQPKIALEHGLKETMAYFRMTLAGNQPSAGDGSSEADQCARLRRFVARMMPPSFMRSGMADRNNNFRAYLRRSSGEGADSCSRQSFIDAAQSGGAMPNVLDSFSFDRTEFFGRAAGVG